MPFWPNILISAYFSQIDLFLLNASINVLEFHHRNIFVSFFKICGKYLGRKIMFIFYFGLFLANATLNVPHFRHINIFLFFLKNGQTFSGKNSQNWLFGVFLPKVNHFGQIFSFRPFSPKRYYKCS